jgi:predicted anti-sigma-YlaC factor YlaD
MSKHVSEWLNAYYDGELHGHKLRVVEEHLAECEVCQVELESLQGLSDLLHEVQTPELVSPERFVSQVNLRLPHEQRTVVSQKRIMEFGWWMIPVGLLAIWVFASTAFILSDVLSVASRLGVLGSMSDWLASAPSNGVYLSTTVGQMGLVTGNSLNWAEATESFTRSTLPQVIVQISIALLYLSWMAIWWTRHTRQGSGQLLEG